jgi:hypothetical protein
MTSLATYAASTLIALVVAAATITVLYRPLFAVILDLCGTQQRARFWSLYLSTILILVPLTFVTFISTFGARLYDFDAAIQRTTFYALIGLTGALVVIGWGIWRPSNDLLRDNPKTTPVSALPPEA